MNIVKKGKLNANSEKRCEVPPLILTRLRSKLNCWIKQTRNVRPTIKISKDKFQIKLDVRNFDKEEIRVKARPEFVIIEGKQEKKTKKGYTMRQFLRKFKLPDGCNVEDMKSKLSPDGILTVTAPRKGCDQNFPCETLIPITYSSKPNKDKSDVPEKSDFESICGKYLKDKKEDKADCKDKKPDDKK